MYNISLTEPERVPEPELTEQPEEVMASEIDSVFSDAILASMMFLLIALWAMKLKDGGVYPPSRRGSS